MRKQTNGQALIQNCELFFNYKNLFYHNLSHNVNVIRGLIKIKIHIQSLFVQLYCHYV